MNRLSNILKTIIIGYVTTIVMLLILSLLLYRFPLGKNIITAGVIVTYALSSFVGGFILAKKEKSNRLLWGLGYGMAYFAILTVISFAISGGISFDVVAFARGFIICTLAGAAGGFISP